MEFHDNRFHLIWTPFQKRQGGRMLQAVGLVCPPSLGSGGSFTLRWGGRRYSAVPMDLLRYPMDHTDQNAPAVYLWLIPRPTRPVPCAATWRTPLGHTCRDRLQLPPARSCDIHVVFKTHLDLGYTAPLDEVVRQYQTTHLDRLLDNLDRTAGNRPGERFTWTMPTWLLEQCLDETVGQDRRRRLEAHIRAGRVVFGLTPFTPHSEFFGLEEMCRSLYAARRLAERFGVPLPRAAKLTDVPAHTASMAMALTAAGGKFLQIGTNPDCRRPDGPPVFWWKLPDGTRLLCHWHGAYSTPLLPPPEHPWPDWLAVQVSHDNAGPGDLATVRQVEWIARHFDQPACRIGRLEDYADAVIRRSGRQLPVVEGEPTDWWAHGIASQAGPTACARTEKDRLASTEIVRTMASLITGRPVPAAERDAYGRAYEQLALYTEHTWGDHASDADAAFPVAGRYLASVGDGKARPPTDRWERSWQTKALFATRAAECRGQLETSAHGEAARALVSRRGGAGVLLFNTAPWQRGGPVRLSDRGLPTGEFELVDAATGGSVLYLREGGCIEFIAPPVPACGYLYLEARPVGARSVPGPEADWNDKHLTLHVESYALQFHAAGGMCRWHDRARSMQWCSNEVDHPLGTFLYEMPGARRMNAFARKVHGNCWPETAGFFNRRHYSDLADFGPAGGSSARVIPEIGPLRCRVTVEANCPHPRVPGRRPGMPRRYRTTFTVYRGRRDLHVEIQLLDKPATFAAEAGYGFFPFYGTAPYLLIDRIAHLVEPSEDFMAGTNAAHLAVHRGVRVELEHAGMNFYPLDAPLVGFGRPGLWSYDEDGDYDDGVLYSTLFANGWGTNFAQWQAGNFCFRYVCRPTGNDEWDGGLARGGVEVFRPVTGVVVGGRPARPASSLLSVETDLVELVAMKPASFGPGTVLRLWSADPDPLTARLHLPFARRGDRAEVCDLLERPTGTRLAIGRDGRVHVPMRPHGITTLWIGGHPGKS